LTTKIITAPTTPQGSPPWDLIPLIPPIPPIRGEIKIDYIFVQCKRVFILIPVFMVFQDNVLKSYGFFNTTKINNTTSCGIRFYSLSKSMKIGHIFDLCEYSFDFDSTPYKAKGFQERGGGGIWNHLDKGIKTVPRANGVAKAGMKHGDLELMGIRSTEPIGERRRRYEQERRRGDESRTENVVAEFWPWHRTRFFSEFRKDPWTRDDDRSDQVVFERER